MELSKEQLQEIWKRWDGIPRMDCGTTMLSDKGVARIYEAESPHTAVAQMFELYDMSRCNALAKSKTDVDALFAHIDSLSERAERAEAEVRRINEANAGANVALLERAIRSEQRIVAMTEKVRKMRDEYERMAERLIGGGSHESEIKRIAANEILSALESEKGTSDGSDL